MRSLQASPAGESSLKSSASDNQGTALVLRDISFRYDGGSRALDGIDVTVEAGTTLAIVGPSGAGKSTLLRVIAGLLEPQRGELFLSGAQLHGVPARERRVALVFQDDALFPTMSVRKNLQFALRRSNESGAVENIARALHVDVHLDRMPRDLSGGERQRVALARALLSEPHALLLDEPLAHLDPSLRARVRETLREMRAHFAGPIVYVTHDHAEAMMVSDVLGVLVGGRLEDIGSPQRVYDAPANVRAAAALGVPPMNLLHEVNRIIGIRPEHVRFVSEGALRGHVLRRELAGDVTLVTVQTERGVVVASARAVHEAPHPGDSVGLFFPEECVRCFDAASGAAIA